MNEPESLPQVPALPPSGGTFFDHMMNGIAPEFVQPAPGADGNQTPEHFAAAVEQYKADAGTVMDGIAASARTFYKNAAKAVEKLSIRYEDGAAISEVEEKLNAGD